MKKTLLLLLTAVFIATPVLLFAHQANNMVKKKNEKGRATQEEEYNQSKIGRIMAQQMQRIQRIRLMSSGQRRAQKMDLNPGGFGNKGIVNTSVFQNVFGFSTFLNHRLNRDMFLVAEIGYFYTNSNRAFTSSLDRAINERLNGVPNSDIFEATLIPLYAGVRKGFLLNNRLKRFYPYVGAGAGPVLGMGFIRQQQFTDRSFQVTPSAYALIGSEIYTNKRLFFDLSLRYRYLTFNDNLANWKNFSGLSVGFGFGYGLGKQLLR